MDVCTCVGRPTFVVLKGGWKDVDRVRFRAYEEAIALILSEGRTYSEVSMYPAAACLHGPTPVEGVTGPPTYSGTCCVHGSPETWPQLWKKNDASRGGSRGGGGMGGSCPPPFVLPQMTSCMYRARSCCALHAVLEARKPLQCEDCVC